MEPPPPYHSSADFKYNNVTLLPGGVPEATAPPAPLSLPPPAVHIQQGSPPNGYKVVYAIPLGPHPTNFQCANCQSQIFTRIIQKPGLLTWLICGALAILGFWPCCIIPFCVKSCHDTEHFCPQCNAFVGKYSKI